MHTARIRIVPALALSIALASIVTSPSGHALPPIARDPECRGFTGQSGPVRVRWSSVTRTPACWFFSGPGDLGRDDRLGESATWSRANERVALRFGSASFEGTIAGSRVSLRRVSQHASGAGWAVTESIEGTITEGACSQLVARYHYDECANGVGACPGQCHIDASITIQGP